MSEIDRRAMLAVIATAVGAGCGSGTQPAPPAPPPTLPAAAPHETEMVGRQGILIRLEGLIAYSILRPAHVNVEVDALLMDPTILPPKKSSKFLSPAHIPTIGIPRDMFKNTAAAPVAVDATHAYWPLLGRPISITSLAANPAAGIEFDHNEPAMVEPTNDNETWRSTGWVMDLQKLYPKHEVAAFRAPASVKFTKGAEFEPKGLVYASHDLSSAVWELVDDSGTKIPGRSYKHSLHAFYPGPEGISIVGLLPGSAPLDITPSDGIPYPIRICNLPASAPSVDEMEANQDAKVYAELFGLPMAPAKAGEQPKLTAVADDKRLFPKYLRSAQRHETCGCCNQGRLVRTV